MSDLRPPAVPLVRFIQPFPCHPLDQDSDTAPRTSVYCRPFVFFSLTMWTCTAVVLGHQQQNDTTPVLFRGVPLTALITSFLEAPCDC